MTSKKLLKTDRRAKVIRAVSQRKRNFAKTLLVAISRRRLANREDAIVNMALSYLGVTTGPFAIGVTTKWDAINLATGEITGEPEKSALVADYRARAEKLFADFRLTGRPVDVFAIRDALFTDDMIVATTPNVQQMVDAWLAYNQQRYDTGEIVERTRWKNARWTNDFWAFAKHKYGPHARLSDLKAADIRAYVFWLKQHRNLSNNVAQSTASHAKVLMNFALDNEWVQRNPFITFRRQMDDVDRVTLTEEEVRQFVTLPLSVPALAVVRDVFFFQILTGLSYVDVERLRAEHVKTDAKGEKYLHLFRQKMLSRKSRVPAIIPLTGPALTILERYAPADTDGPLLPLQANAPFNRSLKQIAFMSGVEKSVSTKVARNSLATYLVNNDVPLESISAMLGHSSTLTTQSAYAKVAPKKVLGDISDLTARLNGDGLFGIS